MEQKIQAIRTEYQAKIKAVIGDKKILRQGSSTTVRPVQAQPYNQQQMMNQGQVKGATTEQGGIKGFFGRLFGN